MRLRLIGPLLCLLAVAPVTADNCGGGHGLPLLDVAPRLSPDGLASVGDVVLTARFVVGLEAPTTEELLRVDIAPATALPGLEGPTVHVMEPDGQVDVADLVLSLRTIVDLSVLTAAGAPALAGVEPGLGCYGAGHLFTVMGRDLVLGDHLPTVELAGAPTIAVGWEWATVWGSDYQVVRIWTGEPVRPAPGPAGEPVDVSVTTAIDSDALGFVATLYPGCWAAPALAAVTPGSTRIGEPGVATVHGIELACATSVEFVHDGTGERTSTELLAVHDDNTLRLGHPALSALGRYHVVATNDCGSGQLTSAFEVLPPEEPPDPAGIPVEVTRIEPSWAREHLAIPVRLFGTRLDEVDRISWGEREFLEGEFFLQSDGSLVIPAIPTMDIEPLPYGRTIAVRVAAGGDYVPREVLFGYQTSCAAVCGSLAPARGTASGGATVRITGLWSSDLRKVDEVRFGSVPAGGLALVDGFQLAMTAPPAQGPGPVLVELLEAGEIVATCDAPFDYR